MESQTNINQGINLNFPPYQTFFCSFSYYVDIGYPKMTTGVLPKQNYNIKAHKGSD
jgi:hypothetical protein